MHVQETHRPDGSPGHHRGRRPGGRSTDHSVAHLHRAATDVARAPFTRRAWAEAAYCLIGFPLGLAGGVVLAVVLALGAGLTVSLVLAVVGALAPGTPRAWSGATPCSPSASGTWTPRPSS
ncbi:hypothetical protein ABZ369_36715, partial [Streptomyces sp. NPDC005918]